MGAPPTAVTQSTPVAHPPSAPVPPPAAAPPAAPKPAAAAAPPKKKKPSKMPGPKKDCPYRLLDQLKDYSIIAVVLGFIVMFGQMLQGGAADHGEHGHGGGHGEEHGGEHHRELNAGHHHVDPTLDMQVTLGICVVLISVTIFFEVVKHHVEHNCPPMMAGILQVSALAPLHGDWPRPPTIPPLGCACACATPELQSTASRVPCQLWGFVRGAVLSPTLSLSLPLVVGGQAMFGELTVLGFIALFTYFCLKFGVRSQGWG